MKVSGWTPYIRLGLYAFTMVESIIVLCITAARLHYTTHKPLRDPFFGTTGVPFYDPIVVALFFASLITMGWSMFVLIAKFQRLEIFVLTTWLGEIVVLSTLWLFWVTSTGIASSYWGSGMICKYYQPCQLLSAMLANAWVTWTMLSAILILAIFFDSVKKPGNGSVKRREITKHTESAFCVNTSEGKVSFDGSLETKEKMSY
ncbi:hypothetical protein AGABI2DRAFT_205979 [Agaricus bisporus var. bisporus H97]|uniref:hypothetical protein n=1 Tax=Agaricus bisporus var. bisporus (strain H97 / ATCC MYA-4626 / FGSC 10389) TaxID=936046 RepID=UPI00029F5DF9|nr:hypothetical protein AGABI2DRAFT_205979 [Agaricus bisporus var. bisporus H97]EKV46610.1 hypothetical protein AGABI2DRAFT_205979 [Agaricus bisporus var. bisporus H97]